MSDNPTNSPETGDYSASLLGTIRSHLESLQGYDVMALELIQNADDAKAEELVFDITDDGLRVWNSGEFTYCGALSRRPCPALENGGYACDYHRITEVASGGKLSRSENIGRFGIGFVSAYQVTDHPVIHSGGIRLTLIPERGKWQVAPLSDHKGTTFDFPWAFRADSEARRALGISHVQSEHITQLINDFQEVLRRSLLFLRHLRKAEVRHNGRLLLSCDLDRKSDSELIITFRPTEDREQWLILRADSAATASTLYKSHPRLAELKRNTQISIGIRVEPESFKQGLLYAYLPTEQPTGLPLHINADFFPEGDRKSVIFSGHQHQQAWNEMLISVAAASLARDPGDLLNKIGHAKFWQLLSNAYELFSRAQNEPKCFSQYWEKLKPAVSTAEVVRAADGTLQVPSRVLFPRQELDAPRLNVIDKIGGKIATEELRPHQNTLLQLGTQLLTLERLVGLMEKTDVLRQDPSMPVHSDFVKDFYLPLWGVISDLVPESVAGLRVTPAVEKLRGLRFVLTSNLYPSRMTDCYAVPPPLSVSDIATTLPLLATAHVELADYPGVYKYLDTLDLASVISHIEEQLDEGKSAEEVVGTNHERLKRLYRILAELDRIGPADQDDYSTFRSLPIWYTGKELVRAEAALLPGDFTDPTGLACLLEPTLLSPAAREFLETKLRVGQQTIENYVQTFIPQFFANGRPSNDGAYPRLIAQLADHQSLLDNDELKKLLSAQPLVPTRNGGWSPPDQTYFRTEKLVDSLGDATQLWVDERRLPDARSVRSFLDSLGIRKSPSATHLVDRITQIAKDFTPTDDARKASEKAFYLICSRYDDWKDVAAVQATLVRLADAPCLPAEDDHDKWYRPSELYAPYRSEAFRTQARILDFKDTARLSRELLEKIGVKTKPETYLVVDHLLHCSKTGQPAHVFVYQILNERSTEEDAAISRLANTSCIYAEKLGRYLRPNQLYWTPQRLGQYAFTIPEKLEAYRSLFRHLDVKDTPAPRDYVDILLDVVTSHYEREAEIAGDERAVYESCLNAIAGAIEDNSALSVENWNRLRQSPTVLNLHGKPCFPDEVLLQDSEWHASLFSGELDPALCNLRSDFWSLLQKLGVKRLSDSVVVELEFVDGEEQQESKIRDTLQERQEIVMRLLHDKPVISRRRIATALTQVSTRSYDLVRIQATVALGDNTTSASPTQVFAFYDQRDNTLTVARPVTERSWAHIFNALFHELMPDESAGEISKMAGYLGLLIRLTPTEAHEQLTDSGVPYVHGDVFNEASPPSTDLGEIGAAPATPTTFEKPETGTATPPGDAEDTKKQPPTGATSETKQEAAKPSPRDGDAAHVSTRKDRDRAAEPKPRAKHKEKWDRRLLSYVLDRSRAAEEEPSQNKERTEHNLAVEVAARRAVCAYEKKRGRQPNEMPQTHPGYDIISSDPSTGEARYIEVKGIDGEWGQLGVGLSRLQFSNAQDFGDQYWLYVVEFAFDPDNARVHPIQNPSSKVDSFMFDGNWRGVAAEETADPATAFLPGVQIDCGLLGTGTIREVEKKGASRVLTVDFGTSGTKILPLNLSYMRVIEESDGEGDS